MNKNKKFNISINNNIILILTLLYINIPVFIYLFGWIKFAIALLTSVLLIFFLKKLFICYTKDKITSVEKIDMPLIGFIGIIFFIFIYCYYMGYSGNVPQAGDWAKHNAIMHDLIEKDWPVYYKNEDEYSMLTYYIGQYLVPAIIGKIFNNFRIAEIMQYIWSTLGIILVYFNLIRVVKVHNWKKQILALFILCFFTGLIEIAHSILQIVYLDRTIINNGYLHWLVVDNIQLQYRSNLVFLRWAYPQVIVMWNICLLFYEHRDKCEVYVICILPAIFFGTLTFLGILPLVLGYALYLVISGKIQVRKLFSLSNCLCTGTFGLIMLLYFSGNIFGHKNIDIGFRTINYSKIWGLYFIFIFFMFGIYSILIFRENYKNILFDISNIYLLVLPFFSMGLYNDLLISSSAASLFIIMICIVEFLISNPTNKKNYFKKGILITLLLIASLNSFFEIFTVVRMNTNSYQANDTFKTLENFANRSDEKIPSDLKYNYYSYDIDKNLFVKYLARKGAILE